MPSDQIKTSDSLYNLDVVYGVKELIHPTYEIWKRNLWGKWSRIDSTESISRLVGYANSDVVTVSSSGMRIGTPSLLEKYKKEMPHVE